MENNEAHNDTLIRHKSCQIFCTRKGWENREDNCFAHDFPNNRCVICASIFHNHSLQQNTALPQHCAVICSDNNFRVRLFPTITRLISICQPLVFIKCTISTTPSADSEFNTEQTTSGSQPSAACSSSALFGNICPFPKRNSLFKGVDSD